MREARHEGGYIDSDKPIYLQGEPVRIFVSISNTSNALVKSSPVTLDVIDQNKKNVIYSASIPQNRTFNYSFNNIWDTGNYDITSSIDGTIFSSSTFSVNTSRTSAGIRIKLYTG
jgi:uncharacterized protein YfaS (alpha-2-macroglobulin family)